MPEKLEEEQKPLLDISEFDFAPNQRSSTWYTTMVFIAIIILLIFYWQQNWSAMIFVAVASVLFLVISTTKPRKIVSKLYQDGILANGKVIRYDELKGFHVKFGEINKIALERTGYLNRIVSIPVNDEVFESAIMEIKKHLPQNEDEGEDMIDRINRIMKL